MKDFEKIAEELMENIVVVYGYELFHSVCGIYAEGMASRWDDVLRYSWENSACHEFIDYVTELLAEEVLRVCGQKIAEEIDCMALVYCSRCLQETFIEMYNSIAKLAKYW